MLTLRLRRTRDSMGSTDDAGEVLATESPVHDVHGTEEKAIDKNTLEQNDETNDIKVAPLASGEEGAVSSKEMEETQQTCDGEDELDATKAEGDTVDSSRNKAIDGSEEECPIEGGMGGKGTADGLGVLNDGICTLIRATALDTINAVSAPFPNRVTLRGNRNSFLLPVASQVAIYPVPAASVLGARYPVVVGVVNLPGSRNTTKDYCRGEHRVQ